MRRTSPAPALLAVVTVAAAAAAAATPPGPLGAQGGRAQRWREIGRTNVGNPVLLDERSVRRTDGIVTATLRVPFVKPVKSPRGDITSARTVTMVDCGRRLVAIKENTYYLDERAERVYERRVIQQPGWAPAMGGSMPEVAVAHFCGAPRGT